MKRSWVGVVNWEAGERRGHSHFRMACVTPAVCLCWFPSLSNNILKVCRESFWNFQASNLAVWISSPVCLHCRVPRLPRSMSIVWHSHEWQELQWCLWPMLFPLKDGLSAHLSMTYMGHILVGSLIMVKRANREHILLQPSRPHYHVLHET